MASPPNFGRRRPIGAPSPDVPPKPPAPPRRLRSGTVIVGAIGVVALGLTASAGYREYRCRPAEKPAAKEDWTTAPAAPAAPRDERPAWCDTHSSGHSRSSSHSGWGFSSDHSSSSSHASFGGFGSHGSAHGGG